ncbi:MAG: signal peptide peptidase SppA [Candidatus Micrarchaeota archaeon]
MEPSVRRKPGRPSGLIIGTALVLLLIFMVIIGLFFVLSALTPSLIGQCVAVVDVDVPLTVEGSPPSIFDAGYPGSEELALTIEGLNERDDVGAVVFVFNSPGGSVVATREVYSAVDELEKPSVSYFREVAASGAYYVASGTDYIVSDPDAITGSIGVITTFTQMQGLFEKIGVNVTTIQSGTHKDIGSSYREMTPEEQAIFQELVDEVYSEFKGIVVKNRGDRLDMALFDNITDGRIMSGRQAYRAGLVDQLGDKRDAIRKAADLSGIEYEDPKDIRTCPITTGMSDGGLFDVSGIFRRMEAYASSPYLAFK